MKVSLLRVPLALAALASIGVGVMWATDATVLAQSLKEARTVADMAEDVGVWASQYGGVHIRTAGANARMPGTFLTRSVYAQDQDKVAGVVGNKILDRVAEKEVLDSIEAYHWKNPALIQRELADVMHDAGRQAQFKMTARTVLNRSNAPDAFETRALEALQAGQAMPSSTAALKGKEYWQAEDGRLRYARAITAKDSCLRCHDKPENAPDFLRTNSMFSGGGGFGYVSGKTAGLISVTLQQPTFKDVVSQTLPLKVMLAWGLGMLGLLGAWLLGRKPEVKSPQL